MANSREFPAFISVEYDRSARGFPEFERQANSSFDRVGKRLDRMASQFSFVGRGLGAALGVYSGASAVAEMGRLADAAKQVDSTLKLATAQIGNFGQAQRDAQRIATETRTGLSETSKLYANFLRASRESGRSQQDAAKATETFSMALKIGGASAQEAASATLQFGQALASGVLRGDEFNSIAEASPRILRLLAESLGVPTGALREMAAEGKLTREVLFNALLNGELADGLKREFAQLPKTVDESMAGIRNAMITAFGAFDRGGQFSTSIANFISDGSQGFASLSESAEQFGIDVRSTMAGIEGAFGPPLKTALNFFRQLTGASNDWKLASINDFRQVLGLIDEIANAYYKTRDEFNLGVDRMTFGLYDAESNPSFGVRSHRLRDFDIRQAAVDRQLEDQRNLRKIAERGVSFDSMGLNIPGLTENTKRLTAAVADSAGKTKAKSAADREAVKAARDAAAAQRELDASLQSIVGQFDPARAAAEKYAKTLDEIARLQSSGRLSKDQAGLYGLEASRQYSNDNAAYEKQSSDELMKKLGVPELEDGLRLIDKEVDNIRESLGFGGREAAEQLRRYGVSAASEIANVLGVQLRGGIGGLLSLFSSPVDQLSSFDQARREFLQPLKDVAEHLTGTFGKDGEFDKLMGTLVGGAQVGGIAGGLFLGAGNSRQGSAVGGAIGGAVGKELTKNLGGLLGGAGGPLGSIAGGIIGGAIGGLFKKHKIGFATIGGTANGTLGITSTGGNTSAYRQGGVQAANATIDSLAKIAEMLGGTYDPSRGSVSIGQSGDSWHVDTSGQGRLRKSQGGFDFNQDYEAAVKFATMDLIKDGVIQGLRASTNRLLQNSKDLDAAIDKASKFESVFTRLLEYTNPVQAALDGVNKEFTSLNALFKEAGASAAEFADLEELYGHERAKAIKDATAQMTASLKSLIADLTVNNDARSLRERLAAAEAVYNPLAAKAAAGTLTNDETDEFTEAARNLLDIQRQLSGSQKDYFDRENSILAMTQKALDAQQALIDVATGATTPFDANSPSSAASTTQPVVSAIDQLGDRLTGPLAAMNDNIAKVLQQLKNGTTGGAVAYPALARLNF